MRVHRGDTAIVHTHPFGTSPSPSDGDVAIAVKLGIPNYVLSYYALWVAMPDGGVKQVCRCAMEARSGRVETKGTDPAEFGQAKCAPHLRNVSTSGLILQADVSIQL